MSIDTDPRGVLVVDDDCDVREAISQVLEVEGYHVETAPNGRAALDWLKRWHPCLMLLDLRMPVMDGFQVLDALQRRHDLDDVAVTVVSAEYEPPSASAGCLRKPFDVEDLLKVVHRTCDQGASFQSQPSSSVS